MVCGIATTAELSQSRPIPCGPDTSENPCNARPALARSGTLLITNEPFMAPRTLDSPLTTKDRVFVSDAQRLLVGVASPEIAVLVLQVGYDPEEHAEGWRLWHIAAGTDRPLDHYLDVQSRRVAAAEDETQKGRFRLLDGFENTWFPRTRTAIRRYIPRDRREAFEAAFFHEMPRQPEGPLVVGSVEKYLGRLAGLRDGDEHARAVYAALAKKGLTDELLAGIRATLDACQRQGVPPAPPINEAEVAAAAERQVIALADLRAWYTDWVTTFRQVLGYHHLARLGLVSPPKRSSGGREDDGTDSDVEN